MTFANGVATFFAVVTLLLLVLAWTLHTKEEARIRLALVIVALITTLTAVGAWAAGHWQ